jgi:hypothetical protein
MEAKTCFAFLSDRAILDALTRAAEDERRSTADLLLMLAEVDRRALYRAQACSSMFAFLTERLHYWNPRSLQSRIALPGAQRLPGRARLRAGLH